MAKDEINAFLGTGTVYEGKLHFQGSVRIDGQFTGEVVSEGTLIIGKDARAQGQFHVGQLVLSGQLQGEVLAARKVVLHKTANLLGTVNTPALAIEEGAVMEGQVAMGGRAGGMNDRLKQVHVLRDAAGYEELPAGEDEDGDR